MELIIILIVAWVAYSIGAARKTPTRPTASMGSDAISYPPEADQASRAA